MIQRLLHMLIALDQFVFSRITLGKAYPDETMSSAAWAMEQQGRWQGKLFRPVIDCLFWPVQHDHCQSAWLAEKYRLQLPPDQR